MTFWHDSNYQNMLFYYHRNIFWGVGAVFKDIKPWFMKKFISLLIISSILQQYLLSVSTLPPLTFKVSAHHHFDGYTPPPLTWWHNYVHGPLPISYITKYLKLYLNYLSLVYILHISCLHLPSVSMSYFSISSVAISSLPIFNLAISCLPISILVLSNLYISCLAYLV